MWPTIKRRITAYYASKEQRELEQVRTAWIDEQSLEGFSPEITSKYQLWKVQLNDAPEEQKKQVKATILATIDELITQKKGKLNNCRQNRQN